MRPGLGRDRDGGNGKTMGGNYFQLFSLQMRCAHPLHTCSILRQRTLRTNRSATRPPLPHRPAVTVAGGALRFSDSCASGRENSETRCPLCVSTFVGFVPHFSIAAPASVRYLSVCVIIIIAIFRTRRCTEYELQVPEPRREHSHRLHSLAS